MLRTMGKVIFADRYYMAIYYLGAVGNTYSTPSVMKRSYYTTSKVVLLARLFLYMKDFATRKRELFFIEKLLRRYIQDIFKGKFRRKR